MKSFIRAHSTNALCSEDGLRLRAAFIRCFLKSEARYARLAQSFPERAEDLFAKADANAKAKYQRLLKMGKLYE